MTETTILPPEREVFRAHYESESSEWSKSSGGGSKPFHTIEYRAFVEKFIGMNNVRTMVDIGCGDWQFSKYLNLDNINYTGFDVVPSVVRRNSERYASENIQFKIMPDNMSDVPPADLLVIKDVLQHLPNDTILAFIEFVLPKYKFSLISNSFIKINAEKNRDIKAGQFRCLDLASSPFSLKGCYVLEFSSTVWERIRTFLYQAI